jgi:hypothetical protein
LRKWVCRRANPPQAPPDTPHMGSAFRQEIRCDKIRPKPNADQSPTMLTDRRIGITSKGRGLGSDHCQNRITLAVRKAKPASPFLPIFRPHSPDFRPRTELLRNA